MTLLRGGDVRIHAGESNSTDAGSTASGGNVFIAAGASLGGQHEASGGNITLVSGSSAASRHGDITMDANSGSITVSCSTLDIAASAVSLSASNASMTAGDGRMTLVASEHVTVAAALGVDGNTTLRANLAVLKDAAVGGGLQVHGATTLHDNTYVAGTLAVTGATTLSSTLYVSGATNLSTTLDVSGAATLSTTLDVSGATTLSTTLDVTGATSLASSLHVTGAANLSSTLDVSGATILSSTLGVSGDMAVGTSQFTVNASSGNTAIAGTLAVRGITTLADDLQLSSDTTALTHTGTTGLAITSTSGYVDVEDLRFTGAAIGVSGNPIVVTVASGGAAVTGTLSATSSTNLSSTLDVAGNITLADDLLISEDTAALTHTGTTGLTITSNTGYVDVEDLRFTGAQIGTSNISDIITVSDAGIYVQGTVSASDFIFTAAQVVVNSTNFTASGDFAVGADVFTVSGVSGNTSTAGTLDVAGITTLADDLHLSDNTVGRCLSPRFDPRFTTFGLSV
jgi:hypothetical protein